jgi:hypothetical protein
VNFCLILLNSIFAHLGDDADTITSEWLANNVIDVLNYAPMHLEFLQRAVMRCNTRTPPIHPADSQAVARQKMKKWQLCTDWWRPKCSRSTILFFPLLSVEMLRIGKNVDPLIQSTVPKTLDRWLRTSFSLRHLLASIMQLFSLYSARILTLRITSIFIGIPYMTESWILSPTTSHRSSHFNHRPPESWIA